VLAETGYGGSPDDSNADRVVVRQRSDMRGTDVASSGGGSAYGADGLPALDASTPPGAAVKASSPEVPAVANAPDPSQPDLPSRKAGGPDMMRAPAPILPKPTGSIAGAADAQARAMTGLADAAPSQQSLHQMNPSGDAQASAPEPTMHQMTESGDAPALPPEPTLHELAASGDAPVPAPQAEPTLHQMNVGGDAAAAPLSLSEPPTAGPATLKTIRLSSNDPPLSVILELSGPVSFDKNLQSSSDGSTATVMLKDVTPDIALQPHLVFDKSIFKDCSISSTKAGTTVTLNMQPVAHFAVVPLEAPPRLLMTFTPQAGTLKTSSAE